jgi:hypothetical protein
MDRWMYSMMYMWVLLMTRYQRAGQLFSLYSEAPMFAKHYDGNSARKYAATLRHLRDVGSLPRDGIGVVASCIECVLLSPVF